MNKKYSVALFTLLFLGITTLLIVLARRGVFAVLEPKGLIALHERNLIFLATGLMLIVVIPVFVLTFYIAWNYRASNTKATYTPDWDHNLIAETIWWGVPSLIILALAVITWNSSHQLDPSQPISSNVKPLTIQVIALQWKWLFIYPEQNIATINYLQFPENTPLNFQITADAPMNSFWIPQLGGQIYAMPGMSTQLHLIADQAGSFNGSSANISGTGFAGMKFVAKATSQNDFDQWVRAAKLASNSLGFNEYARISQPSQNNPPLIYASASSNLYDTVIMKFMTPVAPPSENIYTQKPISPSLSMQAMDMSDMIKSSTNTSHPRN